MPNRCELRPLCNFCFWIYEKCTCVTKVYLQTHGLYRCTHQGVWTGLCVLLSKCLHSSKHKRQTNAQSDPGMKGSKVWGTPTTGWGQINHPSTWGEGRETRCGSVNSILNSHSEGCSARLFGLPVGIPTRGHLARPLGQVSKAEILPRAMPAPRPGGL